MEKKSIYEIEREYDLEIEKIVKTIKKQKAKLVLLQFPDGLKPYSATIAEEIENKANENRMEKTGEKVECLIWLGSCFGACDVPLQVEKLGIDLIIQFGHSAWKYKNKRS